MSLDIQAGIRDLLDRMDGVGKENPRKSIPDTGEYNELHEKAVRSLAESIGYYAESGPLYDPTGKYLCEACALRQEPKACTHVSGKISMETGSCMIWVIGDEINEPVGQKLTQIESNYATRPNGFGCSRCGWYAEAKKADSDGRPGFCSWWGCHVIPLACCFANSGPGMKVAPGE